jgi:predicted ATP-grasp superfamily ATP-dependent carboligase
LNLLIYEYVSGGGYANETISASVLSEGYAMLRSLISDFKVAGHQVTTLLDSRLTGFNPPLEADEVVSVSSSEELDKKLKELTGVADAVYVVAPESGQVLEKHVENVEASGGTSLNCQTDAIKHFSNKMKTYVALKKGGVKVPETVLVDLHERTRNISSLNKEMGYPLIFKPLEGVSCSGLSLVKNEGRIEAAVKKVAHESLGKYFLVQELVRGTAVSSCVFSTGKKALAVSLNKQFVKLEPPDGKSRYSGGAVPFLHSLEEEALKTAQRAAETIGGLKGYVGVDMVLTKEGPVVMEINPRLTMSYIGLKKVAVFNPAQAIVDAVLRRKLPKNSLLRGYALFKKVEVLPRPQLVAETYKLKEVVSPPFPVKGNKSAYALLEASSTSPKGAQSALYRAKRCLLMFCGEDD